MSFNPTELGRMTNSIGQEIVFLEHPTRGDSVPVICACHDLALAQSSDFYELDDMTASHGEYEPKFINGELWVGDFKQ